jgi:phosphoribosylformimino-5-aminoimidazole carboxamide ribotide isomerase
VLVIPAIDLERGRSRIVYWPGAAAGIGAPTDRPDRIVERLVAQGARLIHLVDFEGARSGQPGNLEAVGAIASRSGVPLQLAGGLETPETIQLAFAAGATRVVLTTAIADRPDDLRACLAIAGDWLAVGLDPRPDRLAAFPWRRAVPPTLDQLIGELVGAGVTRLVVAHGGTEPDLERVRSLVRTYDAEVLVAGGVRDLDGLRRLRDTGASGVILGEAILSGAIELPAAVEAAVA